MEITYGLVVDVKWECGISFLFIIKKKIAGYFVPWWLHFQPVPLCYYCGLYPFSVSVGGESFSLINICVTILPSYDF